MTVDRSFLCEKLIGIVGFENVTKREIILGAYMTTVTGKFSVGKQEIPEENKPGFIVRPTKIAHPKKWSIQ